MNKYRAITLAIALLNLLLAFLFPPFDYISPARSNVPTFEGFALVFRDDPAHVINSNFLQIEVIVILANASIAWLLLGNRPTAPAGRAIDWQRVVLLGIGLNLLLALLFPPMENYYAVTRAALPSFDGFYFLFGEHDKRAIVTAILYIEVFVILLNGALLYFLFRRAPTAQLSPAERAAMIEQLQKVAGKR
ncbi:MAG: hypothetical protein A3H32_05505 [Betaproteobacteria bacterium RIFCSPLOWO2_02_FULL_63_19]|nr:MAG: hypothetical protein A3H32_05505 [Betaproteobacteria bacterium RIFCSPLOWO2_02_FULL_63_19]